MRFSGRVKRCSVTDDPEKRPHGRQKDKVADNGPMKLGLTLNDARIIGGRGDRFFFGDIHKLIHGDGKPGIARPSEFGRPKTPT